MLVSLESSDRGTLTFISRMEQETTSTMSRLLIPSSFIEMAGSILAAYGVDAREAFRLMCEDRVLNVSPAYLRPGFAFGGSCLPKDVRSFLALADERSVAAPFLQDLYGATLATVHLAVRDGALALYLDRVSGHASVPVVSKVGSRLPLHATGVGKVLLAHAPAAVRHEVLTSPLRRFTPYTVIQPGRLASQLQRVPQDGYATTTEEMTLGACSIAIPVNVGGRTVASLGIVIPDLRGRKRLVPAMQVASQGIARSLSLG